MPTPKPSPTTIRLYQIMVKAGHKPGVYSNRFPRRGMEFVHAVAKSAGVLSPAPRKPRKKVTNQLDLNLN